MKLSSFVYLYRISIMNLDPASLLYLLERSRSVLILTVNTIVVSFNQSTSTITVHITTLPSWHYTMYHVSYLSNRLSNLSDPVKLVSSEKKTGRSSRKRRETLVFMYLPSQKWPLLQRQRSTLYRYKCSGSAAAFWTLKFELLSFVITWFTVVDHGLVKWNVP